MTPEKTACELSQVMEWLGKRNPNAPVFRDQSGQWWHQEQIANCLKVAPLSSLQGQRVATILESKPLSALVSLAILSSGSCLPLNSKWTPDEISLTLKELQIEIVVVEKDSGWEKILSNFHLITVVLGKHSISWNFPQSQGTPKNDPFNLILLTSGTTGRPKIIPLTKKQIFQSCQTIAHSLALTSGDTCLNFLPMMHIGGLLDLFLAPLQTGGRIIFAEADDSDGIACLLENEDITWMQGAPAMLHHLTRGKNKIPSHLRFIRSVSAPLSNELLEKIEEQFTVPVVEIYGMSETTGVITSNPLPPGERKAGSVGIPVDIELKIQDSHALGESGDIIIRGSRVFSGYLGQKEQAEERLDGWFSTGDQGYLDDDGYLFITGRKKETINRGGQKFSPTELDQVVQSWPEIREAAAFSFPHPSLGEEVGLAIVCKSVSPPDKETILQRLGEKVAPYKIPKRIEILEALPRNENGKLQRHLLNTICQNSSASNNSHPADELEEAILALWKSNLSKDDIDTSQDYFEVGGDSLSMTSLIVAIQREFGLQLESVSFFDHSTVTSQARLIRKQQQKEQQEDNSRNHPLTKEIALMIKSSLQSWPGHSPFPGAYSVFAPNNPEDKNTLFAWCANGRSEWTAMTEAVGNHCSLIGFRSLFMIQKKKKRDLSQLSKAYAEDLERAHPQGQFILGGFCAGASIMSKVAEILKARGRSVKAFFSHDYLINRPVTNYHVLICSQDWHRNPLARFPDLSKGWDRLFGTNWYLGKISSQHGRTTGEQSRSELKNLISSQLLSIENAGEKTKTHTLRPNYDLKFCSPPPRILKNGKARTVKLRLKNLGPTSFETRQGLTLQARWLSQTGRIRYGALMRTELTTPLAPGDSCELNLDISSQKSFRLERLEIAFIEEGIDWLFQSFQAHQVLHRKIFTF